MQDELYALLSLFQCYVYLSAPFHYYITSLVDLSLSVAKECIAQLLLILRADNRTLAVKPQLGFLKFWKTKLRVVFLFAFIDNCSLIQSQIKLFPLIIDFLQSISRSLGNFPSLLILLDP